MSIFLSPYNLTSCTMGKRLLWCVLKVNDQINLGIHTLLFLIYMFSTVFNDPVRLS